MPLCGVVFGTPKGRAQFPDDIPAIYTGSQNPRRELLTSIEIRGIAPGSNVVLHHPSSGIVRFSSAGVNRFVFALSTPAGSTFVEQATDVFERLTESIAAAHLEPRHITRTWYFIRNIDQNYADFNTVRDIYFNKWQLRRFPASTGIGAVPFDNAMINALVEATDAADLGQATFDTDLQCPPVSYGPRFVRANEIHFNGTRTVNISGISSIGLEGQSLTGTPSDLVDHTMASFLDLLSRSGMSVSDIVTSYVYFKDEQVHAIFEEYIRKNELNFPHLVNQVDVCRPDLVFEIEARAMRSTVECEISS